ncbi:hypothetical protein Sfulv_09060 [Streptomyces fulvorobeus]|uniref:acetyl-CoA C-acetyltransferase n=1 Tax=Streptomyces fulvorobeus TaxID=284028 RepID=A0A7J0C0Q7_9ACTN|nr:hypothetical protein [Streptomyces fulvorobeus]GFM96095.1 hypothetical protein Sfulv_09060 [Streptomyces fulvorobeus]
MSESVIVAGASTPGTDPSTGLGALPPVTLGALVIKAALDRAGIGAADVDYVIAGQAQARQVVRRALIPDRVPAVSVGGARSGGLNTLVLANQLIRTGERDVVVVSGTDLGLARGVPAASTRRRPRAVTARAAPGGAVEGADGAGQSDPSARYGLPWRVDRAVAVVLMRRAKAEHLGLPWLAGLGAHSTVVSTAGSAYVQAVRQMLRDASATPEDLCVIDIRRSLLARSQDAVPGALPAGDHVCDTTGLRMVLRLARNLHRRGRGMGAVVMWGTTGPRRS